MKNLRILNISRFIVIFLLSGCATSPTGRRQLIIMPDGQMNTLGAQSFSQMKQEKPTETDSRTVSYVKCVAMAIAEEAKGQTDIKEWEVVVFRDNTANAFALPGGKIGVHTGILPVAKTPGQLAAVLGHEVGHVIARHGAERVSQGFVAQTGMAAADALSKSSPSHGLLMGALGLGTQFGVLLPYSRKHESEADIIGEDLMARAGFDPHESIELWKNMGAGGGKQPPQFMSTHPSHETRMADLQSHMNAASAIFNQARAAGKNPQCKL